MDDAVDDGVDGACVSAPVTMPLPSSIVRMRQKELFRQAALGNILLLRQICRALETKNDHTVPEEFFLDMLDEQFSSEESLRQVETAVNWGRYAELFDFDAARRRFILPEEPVALAPTEGGE